MNGPETTITPASSNIESFTYDPDSETLTVVFRDGTEYDLFNVPRAVHISFQRAGSYGQFYARQLKGRYAYDGPK